MSMIDPRRACLLVVGFCLAFADAAAHAQVRDVWNWLSRYQFGVDYTNSGDHARISYETAQTASSPKSCTAESDNLQRCSLNMVAGGSSGWGFVLQQAFRRQGTLHFDWDLSLGVRHLSGSMSGKDAGLDGLPLRDFDFELLAVVAKPYIQFGWTPASRWPDILISLGPALQVAAGHVAVNGEGKSVVLGSTSGLSRSGLLRGFLELEIVPWRFGDGAFSLFSSRDFVSGEDGTTVWPGSKDGMDEFRADFSRGVGGMAWGFGLKLIFNWP
jgi:hypothetical protein